MTTFAPAAARLYAGIAPPKPVPMTSTSVFSTGLTPGSRCSWLPDADAPVRAGTRSAEVATARPDPASGTRSTRAPDGRPAPPRPCPAGPRYGTPASPSRRGRTRATGRGGWGRAVAGQAGSDGGTAG